MYQVQESMDADTLHLEKNGCEREVQNGDLHAGC